MNEFLELSFFLNVLWHFSQFFQILACWFVCLLLLLQLKTDLSQQKTCIINKPRLNIVQIPNGLKLHKNWTFYQPRLHCTNFQSGKMIQSPLSGKMSDFIHTLAMKCIAFFTFNFTEVKIFSACTLGHFILCNSGKSKKGRLMYTIKNHTLFYKHILKN